MKELSINEKAKRYDEAIDKAKKELDACGSQDCDAARQIFRLFSELKEPENERIIKEIKQFIRSRGMSLAQSKVDSWIAWLEKQGESYTKRDVDDAWLKGMCDAKRELEKQGEQKPTDKVEPFDKYEGLTDFERTLADICIGWIGEKLGWKQYIKDNADVLLKIAVEKFNSVQDVPFEQKSAWGEDDEKMYSRIYNLIHKAAFANYDVDEDGKELGEYAKITDWFKSFKERMQSQSK